MKLLSRLTALFITLLLFLNSCTSNQKFETAKTDSVAANIKMYTHTWDEIINHGKLELFNDSNFTTDVVMHAHPDIAGIDSARAYYANYLYGFSNIQFIIHDVFGQGDKLVTLVKMRGEKIAEEQDFFDNYEFMKQLGLVK